MWPTAAQQPKCHASPELEAASEPAGIAESVHVVRPMGTGLGRGSMPVIAKLIHGDRKEWVKGHSQWKVLPHDDASSTGLSALFQLCWGLSTLGPYGPCLSGTGGQDAAAEYSVYPHWQTDIFT